MPPERRQCIGPLNGSARLGAQRSWAADRKSEAPKGPDARRPDGRLGGDARARPRWSATARRMSRAARRRIEAQPAVEVGAGARRCLTRCRRMTRQERGSSVRRPKRGGAWRDSPPRHPVASDLAEGAAPTRPLTEAA